MIITFRDDELGTAHPLLRPMADLAPDPRVHLACRFGLTEANLQGAAAEI